MFFSLTRSFSSSKATRTSKQWHHSSPAPRRRCSSACSRPAAHDAPDLSSTRARQHGVAVLGRHERRVDFEPSECASRPPGPHARDCVCTHSRTHARAHTHSEAGIASSPRVIDAMNKIDRKFYVPPGAKPYEDAPQGIGHNVTISAPHMHAMCLESLSAHLKPGNRALDVGSGTGYLTVCPSCASASSHLAASLRRDAPCACPLPLRVGDWCMCTLAYATHTCSHSWQCRWQWR